ncbi:MAG: putative Hmp1-mismatch base pair and cruciform DNA recognition protein [Benniella sp.]|nr:MAG: putative Hmp1-mismatch base pair and cruciform DNA recognition protein [Benniella sp.]
MSNFGEKVSNTANSYMGGIKQTIGEKTGNADMAAAGAAQKSQADAAAAAASAKIHSEGMGHHVKGEIQQKVGAATGNTSMEARGHANEALYYI